MRIIVVGCGKVGETIVGRLSTEGHDIAVIDTDSKVVSWITDNYDVMGVVGNGASYSILKEAGIEETDLLIAVTDSDEMNMLCCLFAKKAGNCQTIARVRNPIYSNEISYIKEELGMAMTINPEYAAATEISRLLRFPSAIKIETFARGRVEMLQVVIPQHSVLDNCSLIDIPQDARGQVLVCAVERDGEVVIPNGQTVLHSGDTIFVIAAPRHAKQFFSKIGVDIHRVSNATIVGGGRIAYYLAMQLLAHVIEAKIFEQNADR